MSKSTPDVADRYLIWSNEHQAWWGPCERGYTMHLSRAGKYDHDLAMKICRFARGGWKEGAPPPEIPIRECDALDAALGLAAPAEGGATRG